MPSLRVRPEEAEMEPSVPGPSPWTPRTQACVSDAPAVTHPGSALHGPFCCGDAEPEATPPHHQQPGTGCEFPTDALVLRRLCLHHPALTSGGVCVTIRGRVPCELEGPRLEVKGPTEEIGLAPGCPGALSGTLLSSPDIEGCDMMVTS